MRRASLGLAALLLLSPVADGQFLQQGAKLVGAGAEGSYQQGSSVALSADGNTAIVGGPFDSGGLGAAWVWTRAGGVWTQGSKLVGTGTIGAAFQGASVAISADGNTAIVGGWGDDGSESGRILGDYRSVGAAWVWTRSGDVWTQQGDKLVGSGAEGLACQGTSVALSADGNTAIVGGSDGYGEAGAVWVWTRSGGVWTQQGSKLVGSGAEYGARQGSSVALSGDGNTAIVGGGGDGVGAAWVWTRSGGVWTQQGSKLVGSGATGHAHQGASVSLSADGNTAIVGGYADNDFLGAAWIWTRSGGVWTQQGSKLVGSGAAGYADQGASVSLSADGDTAIVGGSYDNGTAGAAWVWTRSGEVWTQQGGKLVGSGAVGPAVQGCSVSVSADGSTAIVGGERDDLGDGAAWAWTRSGGVWTQQGGKLVGGGVGAASQGTSVALSADGSTAIVGGAGDDKRIGAAWVWTRSGGAWAQQGSKLVGSGAVSDGGQGSEQGTSVALSADGNTAIVGGDGDSDAIGAAWVWTRSGGVWTQQGSKLVGSGAVGIAGQGASVSLSADGNTAIVGGWHDNNGIGAAWVWMRSGEVWTQQGGKLVGEDALGNGFQGDSVSLSADGNTAIVGAPYDDGGIGAAWVWTYSGGDWTQQGSKLVGSDAMGHAHQGTAVSLSADGNTALVGGYADGGYLGAAWVWTRSGGVWTQQGGKLVGSGAGGFQGASVSLSADGNTAIVGGYVDDYEVGAAWVWTRSGGAWTQRGGKLVGTGTVGKAYQGRSVGLSADGRTALVGGPADARGLGAAWVFSLSPLSFYPLAPCRVLDTRNPSGPLGGPALAATGSRLFTMTGTCGVPANARALSTNVTVTQPAATGNLVVHPGDQPTPVVSTISFRAGFTRANNALLLLAADGAGTVNVANQSAGTVHVLVDVNGYFR